MKLFVTAKVIAEITGRSVDSIYLDAKHYKFPKQKTRNQRAYYFSLAAAEKRYGKFQLETVLRAIEIHSIPAAVSLSEES